MTCAHRLPYALILLVALGCEGPVGPAGPSGTNGTNGTDGTDGTDGMDGAPGEPGRPGEPANPPIELEAAGVVGWLNDATGRAVSGGTLYFVPAADVATMAAMPIDVVDRTDTTAVAAETIDEPLEDLIDANGDTYQSAEVGTDGSYRLTTLTDGRYFVVWVPDAADDGHLPGGSLCRVATESASIVGTQQDIRVSSVQSDSATYIGSSTCMTCHGRHRIMRTAHRVGLSVPGRRGDMQDTTFWPAFDDPMTTSLPRTLYYYDCDGARSGFSKCSVSETDPGSGVSFLVRIERDPAVPMGEVGAFTMTLENVAGTGTAGPYEVALTYGGAVYKQRMVTRVMRSGVWVHLVLPVQHNFEGSETYASTNDWPWRDYHSERWYDFTTNALQEPSFVQSFDANCAPCHFTGFKLDREGTVGIWQARAVADPGGAYDYDDDGRLDEINIGCESCHGPGSEHLETPGFGARIVSPSYLTPGREAMLCGRCHSRPRGIGGAEGDPPLDADHEFPRPGIRRSEFARSFTQRVDGAASNFWPTTANSKSHHQQYSDFIRSAMYRNDVELMTCSSCHDPHGNDDNEHQLRASPDDNSLCTSCHSGTEFTPNPDAHVMAQIPGHSPMGATAYVCTRCHMVGTAASGARRPALVVGGSPYMHGDIASHRFHPDRVADFASTADAAAQPIPATLGCALCHSAVFSLPTP